MEDLDEVGLCCHDLDSPRFVYTASIMDSNWDPMEAWLSGQGGPEDGPVEGLDDVDEDTRMIRALALIHACFTRS